jgi:hypothetical protein
VPNELLNEPPVRRYRFFFDTAISRA